MVHRLRSTIMSIHSKKKSTSKHLFLVLRLVTNGVLYSVLKKDQMGYLGTNMPVMVLPDTFWSFQVLNRVLYL